jgi:hypothetical protein
MHIVTAGDEHYWSANVPHFLTTRELADLLGTETWRIRRLYEDGTLPEPDRFAGRRAIPGKTIPIIVDALRQRGWLTGGLVAQD